MLTNKNADDWEEYVCVCVCVYMSMCVHPRHQGERKAAFLLTLIGNRCWRKPRQQRKCFGKFSGLSLPFLGPGPGNQSLQSTLWSLGWTKHFYWMKTWTWALGADVLGKLLNPTQLTVKESENICLVNWTVTKACFNPDELSVHVQADSKYISTVLQIYTFEMDCFSSCYSFNCLTKRNFRRIVCKKNVFRTSNSFLSSSRLKWMRMRVSSHYHLPIPSHF